MAAPEPPQDEHAPLWPPLLLTLGLVMFAIEARQQRLALSALGALVLLPTVWRVLKRRWVRGDVLRGLGMGYVTSHAPLLLGACLGALERPECRVHVCFDAVLAAVPYIPWAGVLGTLLYWAWAAPAPTARER